MENIILIIIGLVALTLYLYGDKIPCRHTTLLVKGKVTSKWMSDLVPQNTSGSVPTGHNEHRIPTLVISWEFPKVLHCSQEEIPTDLSFSTHSLGDFSTLRKDDNVEVLTVFPFNRQGKLLFKQIRFKKIFKKS